MQESMTGNWARGSDLGEILQNFTGPVFRGILAGMADNPREYDQQRAAWIAEQYAAGATLRELYECHSDKVPPPMVIYRWRRMFPVFDQLMCEAAAARAEHLVEEQLAQADDPGDLTAAENRNRIEARRWTAARLDRGRWGSTQQVALDVTGQIEHRHVHGLSDAQLQAIALGAGAGQPAGQVIELGADRDTRSRAFMESAPVPPADAHGASRSMSLLTAPQKSEETPECSVTGNEDDDDPISHKKIDDPFFE
jgi:hypothetical protein